jgi:hypothetical protein
MHVPFQKLRLLILNLLSFEELWHSHSACSFSDAFAVTWKVKSIATHSESEKEFDIPTPNIYSFSGRWHGV